MNIGTKTWIFSIEYDYSDFYRERSLFIPAQNPQICDKMTKKWDFQVTMIAFCFLLRKPQRNPISQRTEDVRNKRLFYISKYT